MDPKNRSLRMIFLAPSDYLFIEENPRIACALTHVIEINLKNITKNNVEHTDYHFKTFFVKNYP